MLVMEDFIIQLTENQETRTEIQSTVNTDYYREDQETAERHYFRLSSFDQGKICTQLIPIMYLSSWGIMQNANRINTDYK